LLFNDSVTLDRSFRGGAVPLATARFGIIHGALAVIDIPFLTTVAVIKGVSEPIVGAAWSWDNDVITALS
jgi:hypothetical protein